MRANVRILRNSSWENWGAYGFVFGFFLVLIGILTQVFEFPRVYNGATNVNLNGTIYVGLYNMTNYYNHFWPWTYPASLFGLFTFITGIIGLLAGMRGTYTAIYGFFTMSVISALFAIYLIIYFAFIISFYRSNGWDKPSNRTHAESVSYSLASTQLAVALVNAIVSILSAIVTGRAIALCVDKGETSPTSYGLSCEPSILPSSTNQNEVDTNYENIIESLLLQQVLLYTQERCQATYLTSSNPTFKTTNSKWEQQNQNKLFKNSNDEKLVLTSSIRRKTHKKPRFSPSEPDNKNSSSLIESILYYYRQQKDQYTSFDRNLIELLVKRNSERNTGSTSTSSTFYFRLQWLAIGLVVDRLFFYIYFTATFVSYAVTLWLIPYARADLTIDIHSL
ncbi:unnamed protein product [Rotaria socialis]|uniref:Uncharacterized protein n=1 Tax=Rotaria socialis TaxID=392032 RepID=A0A817Y749_9BILA|nr:unnamed protein product [Rotaria socialis]